MNNMYANFTKWTISSILNVVELNDIGNHNQQNHSTFSACVYQPTLLHASQVVKWLQKNLGEYLSRTSTRRKPSTPSFILQSIPMLYGTERYVHNNWWRNMYQNCWKTIPTLLCLPEHDRTPFVYERCLYQLQPWWKPSDGASLQLAALPRPTVTQTHTV